MGGQGSQNQIQQNPQQGFLTNALNQAQGGLPNNVANYLAMQRASQQQFSAQQNAQQPMGGNSLALGQHILQNSLGAAPTVNNSLQGVKK